MKLELYVLRELLVGFCFTFGGILVLSLPVVAVGAVHKLAGVDVVALLLYLPLVMAGLIPYVLPLAFLLTVVTTFGRLAADNEWTAICMSGMNPLRLLLPPFVFASGLFVVTLWMVGETLPEIRRKQSRYMFVAARETIRNLSPGQTSVQLGDFFLTSQRREGHDFINAFIHIPGQDGSEPKQVRAERVRFSFSDDGIYMSFKNARTNDEGRTFQSGDPVVKIDLAALNAENERSYESLRYQSLANIRAELALKRLPEERLEVLRYELNERVATSSTYFMFLLLGSATGLILRRGTQLSALAVSVGYALVYYLLAMRLGKQLAHNHVLPPALAAWTVVALGLLVGVLAMRRALRT